MRFFVLFLFFGLFASVMAQNGDLILTTENLGTSHSQHILYLEDSNHELTLKEVIALPNSDFFSVKDDVPNFDFTSSKYWLRFSVTNKTADNYFILETARPITNKVILYQVDGDSVQNEFHSGDDFHYKEKVIPHRKNLFPLTINPEEKKDYVIEVESDGEVLILELRIFDKIAFFVEDYLYQFSFGFYYGLMSLVILIYFFFFVMLKDRAFLYYITYVFSQGLLQFSIDGFSYHHLFPAGGYIANHFVLIIAGLTVVVLLKYVSVFLNLKKQLPGMEKVFKSFQILVSLCVILSLFPGKAYVVAYPLINGVSLISIILSVTAIYILIFKGKTVDKYFAVAFTILTIGAIFFILGNFGIIGDAVTSQKALKISSALEVAILSISMSNKYRRLQKDKEKAQAEAFQNLEEKNALMDDINTKLELQVKERTSQIESQKELLTENNRAILDSIHYAKRIQEAILPSAEYVKELLPKSLVFYRPKDVVSGDFYFVENTTAADNSNLILFAAVDCTGHGVPGAFMSIVGNNFLAQSISEPAVNSTSEALDYLNKGVSKSLHQDQKQNEVIVRDGMDISLCALGNANKKLYFSGAKNPLYIIRKGNVSDEIELNKKEGKVLESERGEYFLKEIKGDSHPIGAYADDKLKPFTQHSFDLKSGDLIYIFSDGFADQFGGLKGKKYKYKTFKQFLLSIAHLTMNEQHSLIENEFDQWKGKLDQLDDVLVIGVRID